MPSYTLLEGDDLQNYLSATRGQSDSILLYNADDSVARTRCSLATWKGDDLSDTRLPDKIVMLRHFASLNGQFKGDLWYFLDFDKDNSS